MALEIGQEWLLYTTPFKLKETTTPTAAEVPANTLAVYPKDKAGVSALYLLDDAGSEREIGPPNTVTGTGTANRLAYWSTASVIAANAALTTGRIPFADANGLPTDSANLFWVNADNELLVGASAHPVTAFKDRGMALVRSGGVIAAEIDVYQYGVAGLAAGLRLTSTRNTVASPGQGLTADGSFIGFGSYDSSGNTYSNALITGQNAESQTSSARGSYLTLHTTPIGSTTRALRFQAGPAGQWGIGGATYGTSGNVFKSGGASAAPTWGTVAASEITSGAAVTAASTKITLAGTPSTAGLTAFSIDVNQANLDHGSIGGLADDDHTQYALLTGRSGGQTLIGGTASGNDLTLQSTSNATRGTVQIVDVLNSATERSLLLGTIRNVSFFTTAPALQEVGGTITNNTTGTAGLLITTLFSGLAAHSAGLWVNPTFSPSATSSPQRGVFVTPVFDPPNGVIIDTARVVEYTGITGSDTGTITNLYGLTIGGPSYGSIKPTNVFGASISNQGAIGVTTAIGLQIIGQTGATNNFSLGLPVVAINSGSTVWTAGVPSANPSGLVKIQDDGGNTRYIPCWA